jgi:transcriptional regulator with XRE-family HTH domain
VLVCKSYFLLNGDMMLQSDTKLQNLGSRLRAERLRRNEAQATFAARIGVSVPTLRKMESGDPTVLVGFWSIALDVLDRAGDLDAILAEPEDLFTKYDQMKAPTRRRASRRTS